MTALKFLPIALFIGFQAFLLQIGDQLLSKCFPPEGNGGFAWIAFQAWAMYFLAGCIPKGAARSFIGYLLGCVASITIIFCGTALTLATENSLLQFFAMPIILLLLVPVILYLDILPSLLNFVPAVFVGSGVFFGFMTYVPGATFLTTLLTIMSYCVIGLLFGWCTVTFRNWYEGKFIKRV